MKTRRVRFTISLGLVACGILVCLTPVCVCSQATEDEKAGTVLLAEGTPIHLVLMDDLQGKKLKVKQTVHLKLRGALTAVSALWYGPDASMPVGTMINAYVNQDQRIPVP